MWTSTDKGGGLFRRAGDDHVDGVEQSLAFYVALQKTPRDDCYTPFFAV
jgi:hypothetical protein